MLRNKEKFGGLKFYIDSCSKELQEDIDEAETLSLTTCEECNNERNR